MNIELQIIIKGRINSRELYARLEWFEPCVIDMDTETYVCIAVDLKNDQAEYVKKICKEYGQCEISERILPIA